MFKLVVLDVDDTIVNAQNNLSVANKKAIIKAQEKGIYVTLASGRMYQTMERLAQELEIKLPLICCNGALVKNQETVLMHESVDNDIAKKVIEFFNKREKTLQLYTEQGLFTKEKCPRTWRLEEGEGLPCNVIDVNSYNEFYKDLLKLLIRLEPEEVTDYRKDLQEHFGDKISAALSHKVYIEITNKGINKGKAVAALAEKLGIEQQKVMTIGDSPNDMSMLSWAGLGVAMGNASAEVQAVANANTLSIENDGVAKALEKYIL